MSLLLVGGGLLLSATFFIEVPVAGSTGAVAKVQKERKQPETPAIAPADRKPEARAQASGAPAEQEPNAVPERPQRERRVLEIPEDKRLKITVPEMARIHDRVIPYASGTDEEAFKNHAAVHLRGTGFPWSKEANVYIAGHRLGYVGTPSWLGFWDLNDVDVGDRIFVTDALGRKYEYKVFKDFVVDPNDVFVTRPLEGRNVLTLQTCTLPDYSRRLIIQAEKVA